MARRTTISALLALLVATACLDPTTGTPPPPEAAAPAYTSQITAVTTAELGTSWRSGCPVGASDLRRLRVAYWGYDGARHEGDLIVHRTAATSLGQVFGELYRTRFVIRRIHPVTVFGADDDASMAANNTSAFNCRRVAGTSTWSQHAYGLAVDINPIQNPYVTASGAVQPPEGGPWANRDLRVPGMVHRNGVVRRAFLAVGWAWGGDWTSAKDYQHFSANGR